MIDLHSPLLLAKLRLWFWSTFFVLPYMYCRYSSMILIKTFLNFTCTFNYCASGWCWVHCVAILLSMHVTVHCISEWSECTDTKAVLVYNVKAYRGTGGVAPCPLKLDIILDDLTHQLLYGLEGIPPQYPLYRKVLWPPGQSGHFEEVKKISCRCQD